MDQSILADLEAGMARRLAAMPERIRPFSREAGALPRAAILTGPRGVGKTTFLLHHARGKKVLYLSADNPRLADLGLYDLGRAAFMAGYAGVIVDEVHFAKDWSLHLKALYDDFPEAVLWASDSSSLVLRGGVGDLSRRFLPIRMPLLSFREFLFLRTGLDYPPFDPFGEVAALPLLPTPEILALFREYRGGGTRPFFAEGDYQDRMISVLDKTLYADIPFLLPSVTEGNLRLMKAIVATLAASAVPRAHVRSLCADWNVGADKLYQLLEAMDSVGLLRTVRTERDTKAKSAGAKLLFADPAFYSVLGGNRGSEREAWVAALCAEGGWLVEAAKDETRGDFVITRNEAGRERRRLVEVGGASKRPKQADVVVRDDTDYPAGKALPLWLLGMSY